MAELFITFGGMYRHEPHPTWPPAHPDGWLTVQFEGDYETARRRAWQFLEGHYAFDYPDEPDDEVFPRGELGRLVLP